jgi:Tfp pilus assembly protein PilX
MKRVFQSRRSDGGSALPLCLILTGMLGMFAVNALRSATIEARLTLSVLQTHQAFTLAERGITAALRYAGQHTDNLPAAPDRLAVPMTGSSHAGESLAVSITATHSDTQCPIYATAERQHYEIHSVSSVGAGARRTHVQGFYICRELCDVDDCLAAESTPVPSYWTLAE